MRFFCYLTLLVNLVVSSVFAQSHHPQDFLHSISGTKDEGLKIYQHYCANCHAQKPLIPLGAPRFGVSDDWRSRLEQDVAQLYQHTDEGFNAMPPRGGCFECTDEQLLLALVSMVPEKAKKDLLIKLRAYKKHTK